MAFLFISLLIPPVFWVSGCKEHSSPAVEECGSESAQSADSCVFKVRIVTDNRISREEDGFGTVDIYVFDGDGTGGTVLIKDSIRIEGGKAELCFAARPGTKVVAGIANSPYITDTGRIASFETLELLEASFEDDNPCRPVMSGLCIADGLDTALMTLRPLLCRITLKEITNSLDGYRLLEDPVIRVWGFRSPAEIFKDRGFRLDGEAKDTLCARLPYDIGLYTRYPGTDLFCYPNDGDEPGKGSPAATFELKCRIEGVERSFSTPMPKLERNGTIEISVEVDSPESSSFVFSGTNKQTSEAMISSFSEYCLNLRKCPVFSSTYSAACRTRHISGCTGDTSSIPGWIWTIPSRSTRSSSG